MADRRDAEARCFRPVHASGFPAAAVLTSESLRTPAALISPMIWLTRP